MAIKHGFSIERPNQCDPKRFIKNQKILLENFDAVIHLTVLDTDTRIKTALLRLIKVGRTRMLVENLGTKEKIYIKINEKAQILNAFKSPSDLLLYERSSIPCGGSIRGEALSFSDD
jgi:hypothetical protein